MDISLDEQRLLADFRRLDPAGRQELLEMAAARARALHATAEPVSSGQCRVANADPRPETAGEPVSTE